MKKNILLILFFCVGLISYAQKEASNWYFGDNAGVSFNLDTNPVSINAVSDGQLATDEGCTSISDSNGSLLFYTDGRTVYNANHGVMQNGFGLKGDSSSTQSAIIIPKPNDPNVYYIFTVDTPSLDNVDLGFHFYEVNMTLDGGLGGVVANSETQLLTDSTEKLSAVLKDCQSQEVWVITFANNGGFANDTFYAYQVTDAGVNTTPVTSPSGNSLSEIRGNLKFSPDGTKLVSANVGQGLQLYDFDKTTGQVSNLQNINISLTTPSGNPQNSYGVEFSPNNNLLYVTTYFSNNGDINDPNGQYGALLQFDLTAADISASQVVIDERQTYRGGLQLGPDGKLYRAMSDTYNNGTPFLSVVNNPNEVGLACNYNHNSIQLTASSRQGLPPFITSFFSEDIDIIKDGNSTTNLPLCDGDTYTLSAEDIPGAIYTWTLNDQPLAESDFDLVVSAPGVYRVEIEVSGDTCGLLEGSANVSYFEVPTATTPQNISICDDNNDGLSLFDFSTQNAAVLNGQDASTFSVLYFESMADASSGTNPVTGNYQNTSSPQTIFARVQNNENTNCSAITMFNVSVFNTPQIVNTDDFETCDNDANPMDGETEVILSSFNSAILGTQNASLYTITYHENQADADAGLNNLPNNYTNQTPNTETIFIRIENNSNTDCFSTGSINLVINTIPEAFDTDIYQCDEQGMADGFTVFNLTEANSVITGNTPDRTVQFYLSQNDADNDVNAVNDMAFNNTTNPQTLFVRVINNLTGCFNTSSTIILETSDTQISNYTAPAICDDLGSEDGRNTFNLNDFSAVILNGLPAGLDIAYYETANDALLENNELTSPYENTTPYAQTIYVRVENDNACYGINEVYLTINPLPPLEADETIIYCLNESPNTITLDAGLNDTAGNYSFSWSTSENTETIEVNTAGIYTVNVTNNTTFCSKTRTITVEPSNIATIENFEIIDGSLTNNQITVLVSGEGEYQFALTNENNVTTPFQASNVFNQVSPGIYTVTVRDIKNNCGATTQDVSVIGFPLYFTPNGDTINDFWQVYGISSVFQPDSKIFIFDRFGKLIKEINASERGWDGTFNGNPMPQSDYWFSVKLQDGRVYKNHFTLKR